MSLDLANLQAPWLAAQLLAAGARSSVPDGGKNALVLFKLLFCRSGEGDCSNTTGEIYAESIYFKQSKFCSFEKQ